MAAATRAPLAPTASANWLMRMAPKRATACPARSPASIATR